MGSQSHYDNPIITMKFIVLACLAISAMAAPEAKPEAEADPYLVRHWNGAVTPVDTYSVQAARAAHLTAKANIYAYRPYTAYGYGAYNPYYGVYNRQFYRREAEAEAEPWYYGNYAAFNGYYRNAYNYGAYPATYAFGAYPYNLPTYTNTRSFYKREAEAEAWGTYYNNYYSGYPYANRYYGAYAARPYTYGYNYNTYNYGYHPYGFRY